MATPIDPELADKIRKTISETISDLGRLPLELAYQVFDNSFLADAVRTEPWLTLHETAEYWAEAILDKAGITIPSRP